MSLAADFARALGQMNDPRFLRVLLWGLALTVLALAAVFWAAVLGLGALLPETVGLPWVGEVTFLDDIASWAAVGLMLALSVVLMMPVAAVVVGFFLEGIAAAVEARYYPRLPPAEGLPWAVQIRDAVKFFGVVVAANLLAFVIYFMVPPLAPFIFYLVNGYLLGREYFHLVAMRRLGPERAGALRRRHMGRIWVAGTLMALPLSLPVVNLLVPILGVAVFTHQFHRLAPGA